MKIILGESLGQQKWDEFIKTNSLDFGLLQSWEWGEFQEKLLHKIYRLGLQDNGGEILAVAQIIRLPLPLGKGYFYIPRGPIVCEKKAGDIKNILEYLFDEIKKMAQNEKAIFVRFDPAWPIEMAQTELIKNSMPVGQVQPKQTLILDISKPEEELLFQMKSKTRYNIKVAQKHGIKIDQGEKYFEDFWRLMRQTSARDQFVAHSKTYYRKMLEALSPQKAMRLAVALYENNVVAANLMVFFGDWCCYLHGASDYEYRDKMAPYLLQWEMISEAKKEGRKFYDFWGVDEKKWPGVTRFKTGFAPEKEFTSYIGAYDLVYDKIWYNLYKLLRKKS